MSRSCLETGRLSRNNGGIKGICRNCFIEIDRILGTNYYKNFGSKAKTVDEMIAAMAHIAQLHGLGALIIDEMQHIANAKINKEDVLNFLVTLQNSIKLPVVFIGTYKLANTLLSLDYRQARRATGIGEIEIGFIKEADINDEELDEWGHFISNMWEYQWVSNRVDLDPLLIKTMFEVSVGSVDRAAKIYMGAQIEAILDGSETITASRLERFARNKMSLSKLMVKAIKSNDITLLAKYEDLNVFDMEGYMSDAVTLANKQNQDNLARIKNSQQYENQKTKKEKKQIIARGLMDIGLSENDALEIAEKVLKSTKGNKDIQELKREAAIVAVHEMEKDKDSESISIECSKKGSSAKKGVKKKKQKRDNKEEMISEYEQYSDEGKIKSLISDFNLE